MIKEYFEKKYESNWKENRRNEIADKVVKMPKFEIKVKNK